MINLYSYCIHLISIIIQNHLLVHGSAAALLESGCKGAAGNDKIIFKEKSVFNEKLFTDYLINNMCFYPSKFCNIINNFITVN